MSTSLDQDTDFERQVQVEITRLRRDLSWEVRRAVIRTVRVLVGLMLAVAAYWVAEPIQDIASRPFSMLSITDLVVLAFRLIVAFWFISGGWWTAFGEGPGSDELRATAVEMVKQRQLLNDKAPVTSTDTKSGSAGSAAAQNRTPRTKQKIAGVTCGLCGATYVSAKYCPKCRIKLS